MQELATAPPAQDEQEDARIQTRGQGAPAAFSNAPELTVVLAAVNGWNVLEPTLRALDAQPERPSMEIIVVLAASLPDLDAVRDRLERWRPSIVVIEAPRDAIPRLRYRGVCRARGNLVAILEDHAHVASDWAARVIEAHRGPWGAVGGAVENGKDGLVNWAVYFCEYTPYMLPVPDGPFHDLPGNNIAYKRPHLLRYADVLEQGQWESWINDKLRADGVPIVSNSAMVVHHIKTFSLGYFVVQRFHFARSYAGMHGLIRRWRNGSSTVWARSLCRRF